MDVFINSQHIPMTKKKVVKKQQSKVVPMKKTKYNTPVLIGLDLGCGQSKMVPLYFELQMQVKVDKVIGVDFQQIQVYPRDAQGNPITTKPKINGVDVLHDLFTFPFPFKDESVDAILCSHFFEHIPGLLRGKWMDEVYRILKPDGKMRMICPYELNIRAAQDYTHQWPPINQNTPCYFLKAWREANGLTHYLYDLKCDFDYNPFLMFADKIWNDKDPEPQMFGVNHYNNVCSDIVIDFIKRVGR